MLKLRSFMIIFTFFLFVETINAQDSNTVYYSIFLEKNVGFGTIDTKIDEGEFKEGSSFFIPDAELPSSPFDFSSYQDLYNALVGGKFGIDYGALNNDIIMKIFIRKLDPNSGSYLYVGEGSDTLFSYFEIRIWELPDSNYYPEMENYYLNEGYFAHLSIPKSEELYKFLEIIGIGREDDLGFAFLEEGIDNSDDWNAYGIESIDTPDSIKFKAIHLSRIGGGKRRIANQIINPDNPLNIKVSLKDGFSDKFSLKQNYPNPFNPSTKINYSLKESGHVSLKIYTVLGNEILTLIDKYQHSGNYEIDFSIHDLGNKISSGVYFYTLRQKNLIVTKKMILTK